MAGVTMLAYGVVFVLLIGEIDLSISYVSGVARRRRRRADAAPAARTSSRACSRSSLAIGACVADRRVPGLDRGADRRARVRRHARRLPDLAGRDPEVDSAGRDRDPGQHGQQRRRTTSSRRSRLDHRRRRRAALRRQRRSAASSRAAGTASPSAIRCSSSLKLVGVVARHVRRRRDLQQGPRRSVRRCS